MRSDFGISDDCAALFFTRFPAVEAGSLRACVALLLLSLAGCGLFSSRDGAQIGYYLPLTVQLRQAPTVAAAQFTYQDACGQNSNVAIR